jgi:hypothetical protein
MSGRVAGEFGSIPPFVVAGVMGYFRVVLHPRLQQDVFPIDLLLINISNRTRGFPLQSGQSSITETESMEESHPSIFRLKGRKSRHQFQINRED